MSILTVLDRPIAFHRRLVDLTGSVIGALLLSQSIYWQNRCKSEDGWWWKTHEDWKEETGLSRKELETARKACFEFLFCIRRGIPAKCFYKVNHEAVQSSLSETGNLDCTKRTNSDVRNGQSTVCTETTTESTPIVPKIRDLFIESAEEIYDLYPKKVGRPKAILAIVKALRSGTAFEYLKTRTLGYARARIGEDPQFTPHPATWFNGERFNDDPATWKNGNQTKSSSSSSKTDRQKLLEAQGYL